MRFLLDMIYLVGLAVSSPVWITRMIRHGRYRQDLRQRFLGSVPIRYGKQPIIWIHGVSLGEVNAVRMLVDELHRQLPDYQVVISSTTETGITRAKQLFAPDHWVFRWPMDFSMTVRRAMKRLRPDLVVLIEGEAWPNFLAACKKLGVPTAIVNARLGADKGYPRYKKLGPLARALFGKLTAIGAQTDDYAEKFRSLGADPAGVHVTGMMKFDTAVTSVDAARAEALAGAMGVTDAQSLVVAGGTGPGEEQQILSIWPAIRQACPQARLAMVPRKPERFDEVARLITSAGFSVVRRSQRPDGCTDPVADETVILIDTMGELRNAYALASAVFVGRSLVAMGGSDMIEAAALGKATAFGPHTYNFPQADELAKHGCVRVADADELATTLTAWLGDPAKAARAGQQAQAYVIAQQGATRRNVEMLCDLLGREPAVGPGAIATVKLAAP
jgi:3-deoxy-D-manno-octulosonic-acid transferase